jgi:hypothetical protein
MTRTSVLEQGEQLVLVSFSEEGRGKREEGRGKREEGRGKREEGRAEEGRAEEIETQTECRNENKVRKVSKFREILMELSVLDTPLYYLLSL